MPDTATAASPTRGQIYSMTGQISDVAILKDRNQRDYGSAMFHTTIAGKPTSRRLMIFGPVLETLRAKLTDGNNISFTGAFDGGSIRVVKVPGTAAPKAPPATASPVSEPTPAAEPIVAKPELETPIIESTDKRGRLLARTASGKFVKKAA